MKYDSYSIQGRDFKLEDIKTYGTEYELKYYQLNQNTPEFRELMEADPEGLRFEEICGELRVYQASLRTFFTLECFDNLIKNGRMRPLVGTLLHSLGIHVIGAATPQGTIQVVDKARGEVKTYKAMATLMSESKDCTGAEVIICHCENQTGAIKLKERILAELPVKSVEIFSCRGLTSFYAMEKGLIVGY